MSSNVNGTFSRSGPEAHFDKLQIKLVVQDAKNEHMYLDAADALESLASKMADTTTVYRQQCMKSIYHDALTQLKKISKEKEKRDVCFGHLASYGSSMLENASLEASIALDKASGYNKQSAEDWVDSLDKLQTTLETENESRYSRLTKMEGRLENSFNQLNGTLNEIKIERSGMCNRIENRINEIRTAFLTELQTERNLRIQTEERLMSVFANFTALSASGPGPAVLSGTFQTQNNSLIGNSSGTHMQ